MTKVTYVTRHALRAPQHVADMSSWMNKHSEFRSSGRAVMEVQGKKRKKKGKKILFWITLVRIVTAGKAWSFKVGPLRIMRVFVVVVVVVALV